MRIHVNGEAYEIEGAATVAALAAQRGDGAIQRPAGLNGPGIAIAVNGRVVPRASWDQTILAEGDDVRVVKAVAGGASDCYVEDPEPLVIAGHPFRTRLFVGTGRFMSPALMNAALEAAETEMVTVAIRTTGVDGSGPDAGILAALDASRLQLLPNTAGATSVREAVFMAELAREALGTNWVKLEVIGDERTLWPDVAGTVEATRILVAEGFVVLPYTTTDLVTALRLEEAGAATVMPLGSMIGSGQGLTDWDGVRRIAERVRVPVVVDAGIGTPSDAARAMEAGASACLINTAISRADNPPAMARAMRHAVLAGRLGYLAGRMPRSEYAIPSSPPAEALAAGR